MSFYNCKNIDQTILNLPTVSNAVSGSIANFTTSLALPLVGGKFGIVANQESGTPSPSSPKAISGFEGMNVYQRGGNLWDEEWEVGGYKTSDGEPNSLTDRIRSKTTNYIPVKPLIVLRNVCSAQLTICYYDKNKNFVTYAYANANSNFTVNAGAYYIRFAVNSSYGTTYNNDISINYPSTDTTYHAYNPNSAVYPITFPAGAGTVYGGYVDYARKKLVVNCVKEHISLVGKTYNTDSGFDVWLITLGNRSTGGSSSTNKKCTICGNYAYGGVSSIEHFYIQANGTLVIYLTENTFRSGEFDVLYPIETPIEYDLTVPEILTLIGTNNIWCDTNGESEVSFWETIQQHIS